MEKFLEAYSQWPPINQLIFAVVTLIFTGVVAFSILIWIVTMSTQILHYVCVTFRGWPPQELDPNDFAVALMDVERQLERERVERLQAQAVFHEAGLTQEPAPTVALRTPAVVRAETVSPSDEGNVLGASPDQIVSMGESIFDMNDEQIKTQN